jgi:hypothetical protein
MGKVIKSKKGIALLAALVVAIAAAVGAYAYFTANGSGTGSAAVGTSSGILLSGDTVGSLYPGGAEVPATVSITNPGSGTQHVGTISGAVADQAGCLGSWFVVDDVVYNADLAAGASDSADTNVRMLDSGINQDACKGLTMTINWSSN